MRRRLAVLAVALLCGCGGSNAAALPAWMRLAPSTQARLAYTNELDPEHTPLYASADAALSGSGPTHLASAGTLVVVESVDPRTTAAKKHVVAVEGPGGIIGWVVAEDALRPVPPAGTVFDVPATVEGKPPMLYQEADDDDGVPFDGVAHVTYHGFSANPGNPEYSVTVNDGTLGGRVGYLLGSELQFDAMHDFRLVAP